MHHGHVERVDQASLDLVALGHADVLQVDRAEARGDAKHRFDELIGVLGVDQDRDRRDAGHEPIEERLALHHRHRRAGADVAQPEDARAVGADRDGAPDHREAAREGGVVGDGCADPCDAGGVQVAHVLHGLHPSCRLDGELAPLVGMEGAVEVGDDAHPVEALEQAGDALCLFVVADLDRDVADRALAADRDRGDVADQPA